MNGCPVGVFKTASASPSVKIRVTAMRKPKAALGPTVHMMAFGMVIDASWSSSLIWTEQSYPMRAVMGVVRPIIAESPVEGQPPLLEKFKMTFSGCARGASTQSGINTAQKPARWRMSTHPSTNGRRTAKTVLNTIAKTWRCGQRVPENGSSISS